MVGPRIVVPFDISDYSRAAAKEAIWLAKSLGGTTIFIHIVESEPYHDPIYDAPAADRLIEDEIAEIARNWYSEFEQECEKKNVPTEMHLLFHRESVGQTIASYSKNVNASLIVIGHHSTHGFGKWLEENVSKNLIDHAPCSVLVTVKESSLGE